MPSASASAFIVDAVPMVLQCPADGAEAAAICKNFSSSMAPAANWRRPFQIAAPEPTSSPSSQPSSIGPPDNTMAGMSTVDAAMICAQQNTGGDQVTDHHFAVRQVQRNRA